MSEISLVSAIQIGSRSDVESIITTDPESVNRPRGEANDDMPLHVAILCDIDYLVKYEIVLLLISAGADVNATGEYGWTPLHIAARHSEGEIAEELIRAGANVDASDGADTPLDISLRHGHLYCIGLFLSNGAAINIHSAVVFNRTDWVLWILCENPNAVREWGRSADLLRDAILAGNLVILQQLLAAGAEINPSPDNIHPLWKAVERNSIEAVRMLLEAGADPNGCRPHVPLPDGRYPGWSSPLEIARDKGLTEIEALLKQFGATE